MLISKGIICTNNTADVALLKLLRICKCSLPTGLHSALFSSVPWNNPHRLRTFPVSFMDLYFLTVTNHCSLC